MVASLETSADTKIAWTGVNPKLKGSKAYDRFEKYSKATTVGQFFSLGGTRTDLLNDKAKGFVKVSILKRPSSDGPAESAAAAPVVKAPKPAPSSPMKVSGSSSPMKGPAAGVGAPGVVPPAAAVTKPRASKVLPPAMKVKASKLVASMKQVVLKKAVAAAPLKSKELAKGKVISTALAAAKKAAATAAASAAAAAKAAAKAAAAVAVVAGASASAKTVKKSILKQQQGGKPTAKGKKLLKDALAPAPVPTATAGAAVTVSKKAPDDLLATDSKVPLIWVSYNPKAEASMAHVRFEKYRGSPTVEAFFKSGGMRMDLSNDLKKGFVKYGKKAGKK